MKRLGTILERHLFRVGSLRETGTVIAALGMALAAGCSSGGAPTTTAPNLTVIQFQTEQFHVNVSADVTSAVPRRLIAFKAQPTVDAALPLQKVLWDFGDGRTSSGTATSATIFYGTPGLYPVTATITDRDGRVASGAMTISILDPAATSPSVMGYTIGDVDGDQRVTQLDVDLVASYVNNSGTLNQDQRIKADIDMNDVIDVEDVTLLREVVAAGGAWPTAITRSGGFPGSSIVVMSPSLMNASAATTIVLAGNRTVTPTRNALGYASFTIPVDLLGEDPTAFPSQTISIELFMDAVRTETFSFDLQPLPKLTGIPGDRIKASLHAMSTLLDGLQSNAEALMIDPALTTENRQTFQAFVSYAQAAMHDINLVADSYLNQLDPAILAVTEAMAVANGMPDAVAIHQAAGKTAVTVKSSAAATGRPPGDVVLDQIAKFKDMMAFFNQFNKAFKDARLYLFYAASTVSLSFPPAAPALWAVLVPVFQFIDAFDTVTKTLGLLDTVVPNVDPVLAVTANPVNIASGATSALNVSAVISFNPNQICSFNDTELAKMFLGNTIKSLLTDTVNSIGYIKSLLTQAQLDAIVAYTSKFLKDLTLVSLDITGLDQKLKGFFSAFCSYASGPVESKLMLSPAGLVLTLAQAGGSGVADVGALDVTSGAANGVIIYTPSGSCANFSVVMTAKRYLPGLVAGAALAGTSPFIHVDNLAPTNTASVAACIADIRIAGAESPVVQGQTLQLIATAYDATNAALPILPESFIWTTGNNAVADVTGAGLLTAVSVGSTTISAIYGPSTKFGSTKVVVTSSTGGGRGGGGGGTGFPNLSTASIGAAPMLSMKITSMHPGSPVSAKP